MDLFPTLVESYDLTSFDKEIRSFSEVVMDAIKREDNCQHRFLENGVSSHSGYDPLNDSKSKPLLEIFQSCVEDYSAKVMSWPMIIGRGWYNVLSPGGHTKRHRHEYSVISGAFYVRLPENSGNICFVSPLQQYRMCEMYLKPNRYQQYESEMQVQQNWLYLFPSWMEHYTQPNQSNEDRITVSFNTLIDNNPESERVQNYMKKVGCEIL
jgi:uncharacterized protein (TIGR02466 family)